MFRPDHRLPLLAALDRAATRGVGMLSPEARARFEAALRAVRFPDGSFPGLDGAPDLYFTFFGVRCLRALGLPAELDLSPAAMHEIDRACADLLGLSPRPIYRRAAGLPGRLLHGEIYAAFADFLVLESRHPVLVHLILRLLPRRISHHPLALLTAAPNAVTPRLAAGLILADRLNVAAAAAIRSRLESRRTPDHLFLVSPQTTSPDLLSTGVAAFALSSDKTDAPPPARIAFVLACLAPSGLFAAHPNLAAGDTENSFYALLALGCP